MSWSLALRHDLAATAMIPDRAFPSIYRDRMSKFSTWPRAVRVRLGMGVTPTHPTQARHNSRPATSLPGACGYRPETFLVLDSRNIDLYILSSSNCRATRAD